MFQPSSSHFISTQQTQIPNKILMSVFIILADDYGSNVNDSKKNLETFMVVSASIAVSVSSPQRNVDYVWFSSGVSCARTFIVSDLALYACVQGLESQGQESSGGRYVGLYVQLLPCHVCLVVGTGIWASKHSCRWFLAIIQPQFVPSFIRVYISSLDWFRAEAFLICWCRSC